MREIRMSGSEGGAAQINASFLPLSCSPLAPRVRPINPSRRLGCPFVLPFRLTIAATRTVND
jgi:hypothetical protein